MSLTEYVDGLNTLVVQTSDELEVADARYQQIPEPNQEDAIVGFPSNRGGLLIDGCILSLIDVLFAVGSPSRLRPLWNAGFHAARSWAALSARICS